MDKVDIFNQIKINDKAFTKAERKVAAYVCEHAKDILYMSITDLADSCQVGDTTVFRFCRTLKFNGYQDFKMCLAQSLNPDGGDDFEFDEEIHLDDTADSISKKLLTSTINALNTTADMLKMADIQTAVDFICAARRIHFFGMGASGIIANEARDKFARILPAVAFVPDSHMQSMTAALMEENDLAISFSYSGSTKDTIEVMQLAKQNHARTICITRFVKSALTNYADVVLLCGANEGPFQGGSLSAKISQMYLIDILYTEYFRRNYMKCRANKEKTTEAIASKLL